MLDGFFHKFDEIIYRVTVCLFKSETGRKAASQFIKFSIIGIINTIIDFSIYILLTRHVVFFSHSHSMLYLANVISFLVSTTFSFFANRRWTFAMTQKASLHEMARFYTITTSGLIINSFLLYNFIEFLKISDLIAKVFSTVFSTIWIFSLKRSWVFSDGNTSIIEKS